MMQCIKEMLKKNQYINDLAYFYYTNKDRFIRERKKKKELSKAIVRPIVSLKESGKVVCRLFEQHVEDIPLLKYYGLLDGGESRLLVPEQMIYEIDDAQIFNNSDIILVEKGAIWNKYYDKLHYEMTICSDSNLIEVKEDKIYLRRQNIVHHIDVGYSLCGVHNGVWAHFLLQFLPKLYAVEELYEKTKEKITIIMAETTDTHINELVSRFVERHSYLSVVRIRKGEGVICQKLYYTDNLNYIMEHSNMASMASSYFTKYAADLLKKNLNVEIRCENTKGKESVRLFLDRNMKWSCMKNREEVKDFFVAEGFMVIEPHKISLDEKIDLFSRAEMVVGIAGSAFMNVLFCRPQTSILVFSPYAALNQNPFIMGYYDKYWGTKTMVVCGAGDMEDVHTNYEVPLERIKAAYMSIISE